ncbi:hypothetical protein [Collimonas sp. OK242]|jgi:hypothetical protein|uniref:hypothetical protein n=1 Tax=Collimonas sp. OK242 TaxID=1798195 RepID=UPI000B8623E4|nr:hypothetical protein [Collimonas sp. OK242]
MKLRHWLGAAASFAIHLSVLMLCWHRTSVAGLPAAPSDRDMSKRMEVVLISATPSTAERAQSIAGRAVFETPSTVPPPAPSLPIFYGPQEVDKNASPYSAPDPDLLAGVVASGLPIRLRLYIDANGVVTSIEKLQALADDQEAFERIERMLRGTAFMPARLAGADVNSYQDLEFHIGPELNKTAVAE